MKRAAIYTRVSTTDQHPEMQEKELIRYVACRNWTLHKSYGDKGFSGVLRSGQDWMRYWAIVNVEG
jgi:DNA invertase Pin-like site-specific DNA recombinase